MQFGRKLVVAAVIVLLAGRSEADPRWWWSDVQVTTTPVASVTPHVTAVSGGPAGGNVPLLLVAYGELDPAEGDQEIWLTLTSDGGCTFCPPTRLTDDDLDQTSPRVAAVTTPEGTVSVQVIFEEEGAIVVAHDDVSIPAFGAPDEICAGLGALGPNVVGTARYVTLNGPGPTGSSPDIAAASTFAFIHFHATWHDTQAGEDDVWHARDLTGRGGVGWTLDPARNLTGLFPLGAVAVEPAIAVDLATDPDPDSGMTTGDRSAVTVVFVDAAAGRLRSYRSIDSGDTFSDSGARVDGPPGPVSDAGPGSSVTRPAASAASDPFGTTQPAWVATAWDDGRAGPGAPEIRFDARHHDTPATASPDWQSPDELVGTPSGVERHPAVALQYVFDPARSPAWTAWETDETGSSEIFLRAGVVDAAAPVPLDLTVFPIPPARALDPVVSFPSQFTHCTVDEATFDCVDDRAAGAASHPSLAADFQQAYAVWADSRDGAWNVFFKRTDQTVFMQAAALAAGCSAVDTAYLDVTFDLVSTCPETFAAERMLRYLVYHGQNPGGPFDNAADPIEVLHDPGLGAFTTVRIDGLDPGTTYQVIVVPEDEARNVFPADFDPTADGFLPHPNEVSATTPAPCAPDLAVGCRVLADRCGSNGVLDRNGTLDPGELVDVEITLVNSGTAPATSYTAALQALGATVVSPAGGLLAVADIPVGESVTVLATIELPRLADGAACGDPVDLALRNQQADGPTSFPDDDLIGCDFLLGAPAGPPCTDCPSSPEVVVRRCAVVGDACGFGGPGHDDGVIDPGDSIQLEVEFENVGGVPAIDFTASVDLVAGATTGDDPNVGPATLAPGETHVVLLVLDVTASCGDLIDVDVTDIQSDGGTHAYPDFTDCEHRVGANPMPTTRVHRDAVGFAVPDGGVGQSTLGVDPVEEAPTEVVTLTIMGVFPNRANLTATLVGPLGSADVTAALDAPLDVTGEYDGVLGGPGHHDLQVAEMLPDGDDPFVFEWSLTIRNTVADCRPCAEPPEPDVTASCAVVADRCPADPALDGDGHLDFGEEVDLSITLSNGGSGDAVNYTAVLAVAGATIVAPAGGIVAVPLIPTGEDRVVTATIRLPGSGAATCGDPVDLILTDQRSDGPFAFPNADLPGCDFQVGDPDRDCDECLPLAETCLHRFDVTSTLPHEPDRTMVYWVPRTAEDVALQGAPYQCPFADGELEPDGNALTNGVALVLYQVNEAVTSLRLSKSGTTILFNY